MKQLTIITILSLLLFSPILAANGQNQKDNPILADSSKILPDEYFIEKAFEYVNKPKYGFITEDNKVSFKLHEFIKGSGGPTIKLQHLVDGIPVKYSIFYIHFKPNGKIYGTGGNYYKVPASLNTSPTIDKDQAEKIAFAAMPPPIIDGLPPVSIVKSELIIDKIKDEFKLIWFIAAGYGPYDVPRDFIIDAHTGEILSNEINVIY